MVVAIDTNIAVQVLNGDPSTLKVLKQFNEIYIPVTASGELLFGAKNSSKKEENVKRFRAFLDQCYLLPITREIAEVYSNIRLTLKQKGKPIPENDIWIAATCIAHELPLMTKDLHFQHIDALQLVSL